METNKLLHFTTVHDTQNLREAAELLNMSHSALSKSLKTLEQELSYKLFMPDGRGISSTEEAKVLYPKAKKILNEVSLLSDLAPLKEKKTMRISTFEVFSTYFLQLLKNGLTDYKVEIHENHQGKLERSVSESVTDLGITYEPIPFQGIEFLKVSEVSMSPYVRKGCFRNMDILDIPFATPLRPVSGAPSGVKGLDGWPEHKFPRNAKFQVDMMESGIELARQGECAIFLPDFVASLHNRVVKNEFKLESIEQPQEMRPVKRSVFIVKRRNELESVEIKKVAKYLRSVF